MTDDQQPQLPGGYGGPPPTERGYPQSYPPQYGSPYPQQPAPYGQQIPPPYGYPPQNYPGNQGYPGYPGYPPLPPGGAGGPQRPGLVVAAAVLSYVNAGLLIIGGAVLIIGASAFRSIENSLGDGDTDGATLVTVLGAANLVVGGLLIAGAIMFTGAKSSGRIMLAAANVLVLVLLVVWVFMATDADSDNDGWIVWGVVYGALAVLPLAFSFTGAINRWLRASS